MKPTRRPGTPRDIMAIRAQWAATIATTGNIICRRCHQPIRPGQPFDLGHPPDQPYATGNRNNGLQPEHRTCNRTGITLPKPAPTFQW